MVASAWILVTVKLGEAACGPPWKKKTSAAERSTTSMLQLELHQEDMPGTAANPRASLGTEETQVMPYMALHLHTPNL